MPVAHLGLLKMDFLGLTNLTILDRAVKLVRESQGVEIDLQTLPLDDVTTFELLSSGNTNDLFQLESAGMQRYIKKLKPSNLGDIAAKSRLLNRYRGGDFHTDGRWQGYLDYAASGQSPYYSTTEVKNYENSIEASKRAVLPQLAGYNLFEDYPVSDIPIHFVSGAEDHETPVELVEEYAAELKAPDKSLTIIQNTGHNVPFDAPKAWADTLIRIGNEVMAREN